MQTRTPGVRPLTSPYSPALDGLRAVCIIAVLLYHLDPSGWFDGGFLGVSVFFTLSGFLITRNLVNELESVGKVDVVRFWSRRIQRLAPAALVTIVGVIALTRITERAWSRDGLARNATAAVWSVANWNMIEVGRTNVLSLLGPLGPMWSLAVEEQFYLGIAILFLVARGANALRNLTFALAALCVASVVIATALNDYGPRLEFGTDTRAGDLAVGARLAVVAHRRPTIFTDHVGIKRAVGAVGLGLLGFLFVGGLYDRSWLFEGPVLAVGLLAAAVIVALMTDGTMARIAGWSPLVALGKISYSLYLVHWPIILVTRDPLLGLDGLAAQIARAALCIGCGWGLHVAVERPIRSLDLTPFHVFGWWLAGSVIVTATAFVAL